MIKKIVLSMLLLALGLLYAFRYEMIRSSINSYAGPLDIVLNDISGLQVGFDTLVVDKLGFYFAGNKNLQHLEKIAVRFSLMDLHIISIDIHRLAFTVDESKYNHSVASDPNSDDESDNQSIDQPMPLLLDELLLKSRQIPIDTVRIRKFEIVSRDLSYMVLWNKNDAGQNLTVGSEFQKLEVELLLDRDEDVLIKFRADNVFSKTFTVDVELRPLSGGYDVSVDGEVLFEPTHNGADPVTKQMSRLAGTANIQLSSILNNDLRSLASTPVLLTIVEPLDLSLSMSKVDLEASIEEISQGAVKMERGGFDGGNLHVRSSKPAHIALDLSHETSVSIVAKSLDFELGEPSKKTGMKGHLSEIKCDYREALSCGFGFDLALTSKKAKYKLNAVSDVYSQMSGLIQISDTGLDVTVLPGEVLSTASIVYNDVSIGGATVRLNEPLSVQYQFDVNKWNADARHLTVTIPRSYGPDFSLSTVLSVSDFQFEENSDLNIAFGIKTDALKITILDSFKPNLSLSSRFTLEDEQISVEGSLSSTTESILLNFTVNHSLSARVGEAVLTSESVSFNTTPLSSLFLEWPLKGDINDGLFFHRSQFKWFGEGEKFDFSGEGFIRAFEMTGFYDDIAFVGLNTQLHGQLDSLSNFTSTKPSELSMSLVDVGLPITDIGIKFAIGSIDEKLQIFEFDANVLGGSISADNFNYVKGMNNLLTLEVKGLQIDQLVRLAAYDAVKATGVVGGQLPIVLGAEGISIKDGSLTSKPPGGIIQYTPERDVTLDHGNPTVKLVADALRNYHYRTMLTTANYTNNGDLNLSMKMKGVSPDLNDGQQINLNLNVSDNVPTLLKSLQSSRVISEVFERGLLK
jgi:hypothetical protein